MQGLHPTLNIPLGQGRSNSHQQGQSKNGNLTTEQQARRTAWDKQLARTKAKTKKRPSVKRMRPMFGDDFLTEAAAIAATGATEAMTRQHQLEYQLLHAMVL